ncbi:MAG: hypothetical protein R3F34_16245 [Planctomycetota bacterium]
MPSRIGVGPISSQASHFCSASAAMPSRKRTGSRTCRTQYAGSVSSLDTARGSRHDT